MLAQSNDNENQTHSNNLKIVRKLSNRHTIANEIVVGTGISSMISLLIMVTKNFISDTLNIALVSFISISILVKLFMIFFQYFVIITKHNKIVKLPLIDTINVLSNVYMFLSIIDVLIGLAVLALSGDSYGSVSGPSNSTNTI
jgi:hypothetical protein